MRRIKNKLLLTAKQITSPIHSRKLYHRFIHNDVPYYSQWESRELVEQFITKKMDVRADPKWKNSGASNVDEYAAWSWNGCGMACLKMILAVSGQVVPLVELGKASVKHGVYQLPLEDSPGMFYKPFVKFIEQEYGIHSKSNSSLTIAEIKRTLSKDGFIIASVTPEIRFPELTPTKRGGHLVLLIGFDDEKNVFYLHNPSGYKGTQENVEVAYDKFSQFFDHKGIEISSKKA